MIPVTSDVVANITIRQNVGVETDCTIQFICLGEYAHFSYGHVFCTAGGIWAHGFVTPVYLILVYTVRGTSTWLVWGVYIFFLFQVSSSGKQ